MIENALEYIKELFSGDSSGHDYYHTVRVYKLAVEIAKQENADVNMMQMIVNFPRRHMIRKRMQLIL